MGLAAIAPTLEMTHSHGQTILEILGARLGWDLLSYGEDEVEEIEMSNDMLNSNGTKSENEIESEKEDEKEDDNDMLEHRSIIRTGPSDANLDEEEEEPEEPEPILDDNNNLKLTNFNPENEVC